MPELPEVETIVSALRPLLQGKRILAAELLWQRTLASPAPGEFLQRIAGQSILDSGRRGKFAWLRLSEDNLFIHLRMSGDLWLKPEPYAPAPHDRLLLRLSGEHALVFNDTRKFGRVWLSAYPEEVIGSLGPEPLDADFTIEWLQTALRGRHRRLKPLLLDQGFIAGLGNIYTDEALHMARLHPLRLSDDLTEMETARLWNSIRETLRMGLEHNGASIDWVYRGGDFQNHFRVYGRTGQPCPVCGTPVERILVGQRGTHFCPGCQPEEAEP